MISRHHHVIALRVGKMQMQLHDHSHLLFLGRKNTKVVRGRNSRNLSLLLCEAASCSIATNFTKILLLETLPRSPMSPERAVDILLSATSVGVRYREQVLIEALSGRFRRSTNGYFNSACSVVTTWIPGQNLFSYLQDSSFDVTNRC